MEGRLGECSRAQRAPRLTSLKRQAVTQALLLCSATGFVLATELLGVCGGASQGPPSNCSLSSSPGSRAGGGGVLWGGQALFPALLFRDQKMVLWLSHGPTICDMLTA